MAFIRREKSRVQKSTSFTEGAGGRGGQKLCGHCIILSLFLLMSILGHRLLLTSVHIKLVLADAGKDDQITMCAVPVPGINHFWNILGHGHG